MDDAVPLRLFGVEIDERVERGPVRRVLFERLVEHVDGFARLALSALDHALSVEHVDEEVGFERIAMLNEQHLIVLERLLPILAAK